jgi:hypothetical protein
LHQGVAHAEVAELPLVLGNDLEGLGAPVTRHDSDRAGTIDDSSRGLDSPGLDASTPRSPPAEAPSVMRSRRDLVLEPKVASALKYGIQNLVG